MISTMDTPVKIRLHTTIIVVGSHHQQIVHIQLNPRNRNILGRTYAGLFQNPLNQSMNPTVPIPKVHQTKGLTGRKIEKMAWALTLLQNPETLRIYEDFAREAAYETDDTQPLATSPPTRRTHNGITIPLPLPVTGGLNYSAKRVPPRGPPAWTLTKTCRRGRQSLARFSKTTTHHTNKETLPSWTHPPEYTQETSSPPSTYNPKKPTSPRPTQATKPYNHRTHASPLSTRLRRKN
jgi:hypothetical protein